MSNLRHSKRKAKKPTHSNMIISRAGAENSQAGVLQPRFPLASTVQNKTYRFIQTISGVGTITSSTSGTSYSSLSTALSGLDQYTSFTGLFDQYRIRMVEAVYRPRVNAIGASASTNTGTFITVVDNDDSNNLTSFAQAQDYENAIAGTGFQAQNRTYVPHAALAAYSGSFSSYSNIASPWIDCTSSGVIHYGVKTAWSVTDLVYEMDVTSRIFVEFRNVR